MNVPLRMQPCANMECMYISETTIIMMSLKNTIITTTIHMRTCHSSSTRIDISEHMLCCVFTSLSQLLSFSHPVLSCKRLSLEQNQFSSDESDE